MKKRKDRERNRERNERRWFTVRENWPVDSPVKRSQGLRMSVTAIEAAGSIQEALRIGMLKGTPRVIEFVIANTPQSRGGSLNHPTAETEWNVALADAIDFFGIDMQIMRKRAEELKQQL